MLQLQYNLNTLFDMREKFGLVTGLSDHTTDNITAITSVALGASIIEKHVTLDKNGGGPDDSFSLEPEDLKQLCVGAKNAWSALGKVDYSKKTSEKEKNKDWSSHTNQSIFCFFCELKLIVIKYNNTTRVFFLNNLNLYQFCLLSL